MSVCNPMDRMWRNRWRTVTFVGGALAFWMGLSSPVPQGVAETPAEIKSALQARSQDKPSTRLANRLNSAPAKAHWQ